MGSGPGVKGCLEVSGWPEMKIAGGLLWSAVNAAAAHYEAPTGAGHFAGCADTNLDFELFDTPLPSTTYTMERICDTHAHLRECSCLRKKRGAGDICAQADAWEFVTKHPEGLDAVNGDFGVQLSGGHLAIILAHRYKAIQHADLIIEIREEGANRLKNWMGARQCLMRDADTLTLS